MASLTGDGAYDRDDIYAEVAVRHPDAAVRGAATLERGAKRHCRDRADAAARSFTMPRRARAHGLGSVEIHREFMTAAARWIMAAKL